MKKVKLLIIMIMICFAHIINGELFQRQLKYVPSINTNFSFTTLPRENQEKVIKDLCSFATNNNVLLYMEIPHSFDISTYEINLYCSSPELVKSFFSSKCGIKKQEYYSVFSGKTKFHYFDAQNVPNLYSCSCIYLIGETDDINNYHSELASKYTISKCNDGYIKTAQNKIPIIVMCFTGIILLLLTLYELSIKKKGTVISLSLGEGSRNIIIKNMLSDTLCLLIFYFVSILVFSNFTYPFYNFNLNTKLFIIILTVNNILYLKINLYSFKKAFARNTFDNELLTASYLIKFLSTTVTIIVLLPNCLFIKKAISYNYQDSFFSQLKDYNYITFGINQDIQTDDIETDLQIFSSMNETYDYLYKKSFFDNKVLLIMNVTPDKDKVPMIYYNRSCYDYLGEHIQELKSVNHNEKIYICVPEKSVLFHQDDTSIIDYIKRNALVSLDKLYNYECEVIRLNYHVSTISIDSYLPNGSEMIDNAVIIFNNIDESKAIVSGEPKGSFWAHFRNVMMYKICAEEFEKYMESQGFTISDYRYTITNVYEDYLDHKSLINRELLIVSIISSMLIILQAGIIMIILKLEYQIKSSEYCIKKVLGYSSFEINHYIYLHTLFNYILINIAMLLFYKETIQSNLRTYIILEGLVFIFEVIVEIIYSRKMNSVNINKVLKGGRL